MYKKTLTYTDFDGNQRTEDFYFNLTDAELSDMNFSVDGGMDAYLEKIINDGDPRKTIEVFKEIVLKAYGEKDASGKHFYKSDEITREFVSTQAYSDIYMELGTNDLAAEAFVKGIMPKDVRDKAEAMELKKSKESEESKQDSE